MTPVGPGAGGGAGVRARRPAGAGRADVDDAAAVEAPGEQLLVALLRAGEPR